MLDGMKNLFDSLVRTFVPIIVGAVVGFFVSAGIELDPEFELSMTAAITSAASMLWYTLVRLFEVYVSPKFGWLLGAASQPEYDGLIHTPAVEDDDPLAQ